MSLNLSSITLFRVTVALAIGVFFVVVGGGLALLATLAGSFIILIAVPVFWLRGRRRAATILFGGWGIYLVLYATVSTGMALMTPHSGDGLALGQEFCADAGCFAVDKIDQASIGPETEYVLSWHLSNTDKTTERHFPGKGLELFVFDNTGRKFTLPKDANPYPLDVVMPAGGTVRQSMTFRVPGGTHPLFLSAKYRPFTFQSLLPGELSLLPHAPAKLMRIS